MEDFALAEDREKFLEQLIPGTEDYYYYNCLHLQHTKKLSQVSELSDKWIERHGYTSRVEEILNRQALLMADEEPEESLERIRDELDLTFDHQRRAEDQQTSYPTSLDQSLISLKTLARQAMSERSNLDGFTDQALEWLSEQGLKDERRRNLLERLLRPDLSKLVDLVLADLDYRHSGGFGSLPIHKLMLTEQLDQLLKKRPQLLKERSFVHARIKKIQPGPEEDWQNDSQLEQAYLDRLWSFVSMLSPAFNNLKVHVLYHRLAHDQRQGTYDRSKFQEYLRLPRRVSWTNPKFLERRDVRDHTVNLGDNFQQVTLLDAVHDDQTLVQDYLEVFLRDDKNWSKYKDYIRDDVLKRIFAQTKILYGLGDMEQHYSTLDDPALYKSLKERIELKFAPSNPEQVGLNDPIKLEVDVKNVEKLVVKVFQINTLNYFLANGREPDTSIDLDGLIASEETSYTYEEPPLRRVRRSFEFAQLDQPGLYVIELIGNGKSSRALIRKGLLRFTERVGAAGHVFTILSEDNRRLPDATLWMAGREYTPDDKGRIHLPYSSQPANQSILLSHGSLCTASTFRHQSENYNLSAAIHLERESLLKRREARVVVRPLLTVNGLPTSLELLEEPSLVIESSDRHQVSSTREVGDFKLQPDGESHFDFKVPEDLASLRITLKGKVENISRQEKQDLSTGRSFQLNGIDQSDKIACLHLSRTDSGQILYLLGKTGEACPGTPLVLTLSHRYIEREQLLTLQTDDQGRIELGPLADIAQLKARTPDGEEETWQLSQDHCRYPRVIHGQHQAVVRLPYCGRETQANRLALSLLETKGGTFCTDWAQAVKLADGFLEISGLPPGDYDLLLKESKNPILLRISAGERDGSWFLSGLRQLERRYTKALHIPQVELKEDKIRVRLANHGSASRVHVLASRYVPSISAWQAFASLQFPEPQAISVSRGNSAYLSGRDIGDEYRYILDRKYARKYSGNMLTRPGLLLNPWAVRSTDTDTAQAEGGEDFGAVGGGAMRSGASAPAPQPSIVGPRGSQPNLDFLAQEALVLCNLRPDSQGWLEIERAELSHTCQVRILAVDGQDLVMRQVYLPEVGAEHQDLRLDLGLDPEQHYTEKKQISPLQTGQELEVEDITTSRVELYDNLARVYNLFLTLSDDSTLPEFGFILDWPELSPEQKRERYSKYSCHELNLFLERKDPQFFKQVIQPYLANKRHKTFMDHYLTEADLSPYLEPWAYGRLNILERILLAGRMDGQKDSGARHTRDLLALLPPDVERDNHLFKTALEGSALESEDALGLEEAQKGARREMKKKSRARRAPARPKSMPPPAPAGLMAKCEAPCEPEPCVECADEDMEECEMDVMDMDGFADFDDDALMSSEIKADLKRRDTVRSFYRKLDSTQEWAENNYYHLTLQQQGPELIGINAFWNDLAQHDGSGPFLSRHVALAAGSFTEMLCALAMLDLPFPAGKPEVEYQDTRMLLKVTSPAIIFHKEIKPSQAADGQTPILVSQNYFRADDRYTYEDGEAFDKYAAGELLTRTVYLCQVVLTNPTSTRQKLDLLLQIPRGSIPVSNGFVTRGRHLRLESYATERIEYAFYFPKAGRFAHFPVQVNRNEELIAAAEAKEITVVDQFSQVDRSSWAWLSQNGDESQVLEFMGQHNLERLDLNLIAWRMKSSDFFAQTIGLLKERHVYNHTLWSYAISHGQVPAVREFLTNCDDFLRECGLWIESPLVDIKPVERAWYEHLEYSPLVNARAHPLGGKHKILNNRFSEQYERFCSLNTYRPELDDDQWLAACYYLLLQDRTEEGLAAFARVDRDRVATKIQYDYLKVFVSFFSDDLDQARETAQAYRDYPVERWARLFRQALSQIDEVSGGKVQVSDEEDRDQRQAALADSEASFEFEVSEGQVSLRYQNLEQCTVNYYLMDVELLFSRQPFVQQQSEQFSFVKPNHSAELTLEAGQRSKQFPLLQDYLSANLVVEVEAGGVRKSQASYANQLDVQLIENYGQVRVAQRKDNTPLSGVYVKAYARMDGGEVRFYKDGYTDARGRFDYSSLNTNELDMSERFAILILSEEHGAVIREAKPPQR